MDGRSPLPRSAEAYHSRTTEEVATRMPRLYELTRFVRRGDMAGQLYGAPAE